jgi:hypothetical protein
VAEKKRDDLSQEFMDSTEFRLIRFADFFVAAISSNQVLYAEFSQTSKETHQADATAKERKTLVSFIAYWAKR